MYCKQCGQRLEKDALFCFHCGAEQELIEEPAIPAEPEKAYCTQCGAELRQGAAFCVRCGAGREEPPIGEQPAEPLPEPPDAEPVPDKAFCIQCGAELEEGAVFCLMCGTRQDSEAPVMAPTPEGEQLALSSEPAKAKKKGRVLAIVLPVFLLAVALGALMTLRPWETREAAAPELEAPAEMPPEEGEAPLQTAPAEAPQEAKPTPGQPDIGTALTVTSMPAPAAAFTPVPITEGDYAFICHITGYHLGSDPAEDAMIMSDLWDVLSDRSFRISLADGSFDSGYHITGVFGKLGFADGEPPVLHGFGGGQEDARWQFSAAEGDMYIIHLMQAPGYALAHVGDTVFLTQFDPADPRQHWILADPKAAESAASESEMDDMSLYIYGLASRDMDISELSGLDEETVGYIRNGIYALAGKIFKTKEYQEYFSAQSWYIPYSDNNDLVTARFNSHMEHNLNVCIEYEKLMGWR